MHLSSLSNFVRISLAGLESKPRTEDVWTLPYEQLFGFITGIVGSSERSEERGREIARIRLVDWINPNPVVL